MDDRDYISALEARMRRMENMMEQLLSILSTSGSEMQKAQQMQTMLQELRGGQGLRATHTVSASQPAAAPPGQPLNEAIQAALQKGDNLKAIKLYRELYGVTLQGAAEALGIQLHGR